MNKGKTIALVNQKGGVGKTTTTFNLGACLAEAGKKVLLVDVDQQGSLTYCLGNDIPDCLENTIANVMELEMTEIAYDIHDYITSSCIGTIETDDDQKIQLYVDYLSCNVLMSTIEVSLVNAYCRESILKNILLKVKEDYDYILLDCGPSLGMITINALTAADTIIITVEAEKMPTLGIDILLKNILRVKRHLNKELDVEGILFVNVEEDEIESRDSIVEVKEKYNGILPIYEFLVPHLTEVKRANRQQTPLIFYKSRKVKKGKSRVADMYRRLAQEVINNGK